MATQAGGPHTRRDKSYLYPSKTTTHDTSTHTTLTALTYTHSLLCTGRRNTASIHLFRQSSSLSLAVLPTSIGPRSNLTAAHRPPLHPEERPATCRLV
mmetsp:Transcript_16602/g.39839  ORF Transcript_16602/g.39839 Transcript_16602/m.39839 type:complete len:98 (-) Transcript_16602:713-1006(-)